MTENEFNSGIEKVDGTNGWFGGERWDYGIAFKDQNPSLSVALGISVRRKRRDRRDGFIRVRQRTDKFAKTVYKN
jgi:hypothetical protein